MSYRDTRIIITWSSRNLFITVLHAISGHLRGFPMALVIEPTEIHRRRNLISGKCRVIACNQSITQAIRKQRRVGTSLLQSQISSRWETEKKSGSSCLVVIPDWRTRRRKSKRRTMHQSLSTRVAIRILLHAIGSCLSVL